jgi:glycosyltransferase involved in cell wall biosynthesis
MSPADETALREQVKTLGEKGVNEHGLVGHEELHRAFGKASLWTYPCTAQETFCITAIKAQASGAVPVIIDGTALKETVRHGYKCDKPEEYLQTLLKAMNDAKAISLDQRKQMKNFVEEEYSWRKIAEKWHAQFQKDRSLLSENKTP